VVPAALRELGYEEGRNIEFDYRYAQGKEERLAGLASDLVAAKPDLILALLNPEILAAKRATSTIPIVMAYALTPVESGLIASLARPGGNITGTTIEDPEMGGKKLEILRDTVPHLARVTGLWEPEFPGMDIYYRATERAAKAMDIRLTMLPARTIDEMEHAFTLITRERPDALLVVPTGAIAMYRKRVVEFAASQRLPAMYTGDSPVADASLMSYSPDFRALAQQTAIIIDHVLKGAKPADIPVEQPTLFKLLINLKTAKALGLTFPQSILLRATVVIE